MNEEVSLRRFFPQFDRNIYINQAMTLSLFDIVGVPMEDVEKFVAINTPSDSDAGLFGFNFVNCPLQSPYKFLYTMSSNYSDDEVRFIDKYELTQFIAKRLEEVLSPLMIDKLKVVFIRPILARLAVQLETLDGGLPVSDSLEHYAATLKADQQIIVDRSGTPTIVKAADVKPGDLLTGGLMTRTDAPAKVTLPEEEVLSAAPGEVHHNRKPDPAYTDATPGVTAETVQHEYTFNGGIVLSIHGTENIIQDEDASGIFELTYGTATVPNKIRISNPNLVPVPYRELYDRIVEHVKKYMLPTAKVGILYLMSRDEGLIPVVYPADYTEDPEKRAELAREEAARVHEERIAWVEGVNVSMTMEELKSVVVLFNTATTSPTQESPRPGIMDFEEFKESRGAAFMRPYRVIYKGLYPAFAFVTHGGWGVIYPKNGSVKIDYNRSVEYAVPSMVNALRDRDGIMRMLSLTPNNAAPALGLSTGSNVTVGLQALPAEGMISHFVKPFDNTNH